MRVCIDIGGTKTLIAKVNDDGTTSDQVRFETPELYQDFLAALKDNMLDVTGASGHVVVGAPGKIDRSNGSVIAFGNRPWLNTPLKTDLENIIKLPVYVENDANLAALGEYHALITPPHQVLYLTVSTGIGTGIITDGIIDPDHADSEGGELLIEHNDQITLWEKVVSGSAIVQEFGTRASDIQDPAIWEEISRRLSLGLLNILSILEPDLIIIGGGVGTHFDKFSEPLKANLSALKPKLITVPPIIQASQPENAVILGSNALSKQLDGKTQTHA